MKTKFATALMAAEPARAAPLNHVRRLRRELPVLFWVWFALIVDYLFEIRPEDMELGFFEVAEVIFLYREGEEAGSAERHEQTGGQRDPGKFEAHLFGRKPFGRPGAKAEVV
jgi:hypothetical protein